MPEAAPISLRRFVLTIVAPIAVAALGAAALVCGVLYWSGIRADQLSASREENLVRLVILQLRDQIAYDQESSTVWDEAIDNVRKNNVKWIDANLGSWSHTYFGHDGAIILNAEDQAVFASIDGKISPAASTYATLSAQARPLVRRMRRVLAHWDGTSLRERNLSPSVADLAVVNERPAVISLKPIISDTGEIKQERGTEYLHLALRYLDRTFLDNLRRTYLVEGLRFSWNLDTRSGEAAVPLRSSAGRDMGYLIWTPYRPGTAVISSVTPVLGFLFLVIAAVLGFLILRLYERSVLKKQAHSGTCCLAHLASGACQTSFRGCHETDFDSAPPNRSHLTSHPIPFRPTNSGGRTGVYRAASSQAAGCPDVAVRRLPAIEGQKPPLFELPSSACRWG